MSGVLPRNIGERRERREATAKVRAAEVESGLTAAIAEFIETVPLADEQRERLTEVGATWRRAMT